MNRAIRRAAVLVALTAAPGRAQSTQPVQTALDILRRDNAWTLDQQVSLCEIPAPPFKEGPRAAAYARRMEALGYRTTIDQVGNVIATRAGTGGSIAPLRTSTRRQTPHPALTPPLPAGHDAA